MIYVMIYFYVVELEEFIFNIKEFKIFSSVSVLFLACREDYIKTI